MSTTLTRPTLSNVSVDARTAQGHATLGRTARGRMILRVRAERTGEIVRVNAARILVAPDSLAPLLPTTDAVNAAVRWDRSVDLTEVVHDAFARLEREREAGVREAERLFEPPTARDEQDAERILGVTTR